MRRVLARLGDFDDERVRRVKIRFVFFCEAFRKELRVTSFFRRQTSAEVRKTDGTRQFFEEGASENR